MTGRRRALLAFALFDALVVALLVGLYLLRIQGDDRSSTEPPGMVRLEEPVPLQDFRLTDQFGSDFRRADLLGKWQFIFFGFTSCPDICPFAMQALESFYRGLDGDQLQQQTGVIMVSVDPLRDTPEVMAEFVGGFHDDFIGLTGEYPAIAALAEQLYFAFSKPGEHAAGHAADSGDYEVAHSDYIGVIDPNGRYRGIIQGPHSQQRLLDAYRYFRD